MLSDPFRAAVESGNVDAAADLFSEAVTFRSPVVFKPYQGRDQVVKVQAAERVLGPAELSSIPLSRRFASDPNR